MKVLQIAKYYPPVPGGIESFVRDLSHGLVAEGHNNLVLAHKRDSDEPSDITGPMGRIVRIPSYGELMHAPIAPSYVFHLSRLLTEFKPDILLIHMPNVSGFWPLFMALSCPIVVYWHADVIFPPEKRLHRFAYAGYSFFERALLKRASKIITTSPPYLESSVPLQPYRAKCVVIPLGVDAARIPSITHKEISEVKKKVIGNSNAQYVYSAGRFAHYKGFDRLIRAAAETRMSLPTLKYVIAGDGETRLEMLRLVEALGLETQVFLPGHVTDHDYWALMKGCKLFCLPSIERTEAFGIVLLEAIAMGKPCISTDIPGSGTGWVNRHGKTGLVIKSDDVQALINAISVLVTSKENYPVEMNLPLGINEIARLVSKTAQEAQSG